MAAATETVAIDLQVTGDTEAAKALEQLRQRLQQDTAALREMQAAMRSLQQSTTVDVNAFKQLRDMITAKKAAIASANTEFLRLGGTFGKVAKPTQELTDTLHETGTNLDAVALAVKRGGFGGFADQFFDMSEALSTTPGLLMVIGSLAVMASAAILAGFAAATAALIKFGIGAASAARETGLLLASVAKAPDDIASMMAAIDNVADVTPKSRDELAKMAVELRKTGLAGKALESALLKKATKGTTLGVAAEQSRSLGVQAMRLKENLINLFSGVKLDPLLNAFKEFVDLFNESTSSGRALKTIIESLFNPLIEALGLAGPGANQFFKGMVIAALKFAIVLQLIRIRLKDMTKDVDLDQVTNAMLYMGMAAAVLAVALGIVAVGVGILVGALLLIPVIVFAISVAMIAFAHLLISTLMGMPAAFMSILNFLYSRVSALVDIGYQFAAGLAEGIRSGLSEVINAAISIAQGAVDAVKDKLKIASPSKVFAELGMQMSSGVAKGVEGGEDKISSATENAVNVPSKAGAVGGKGGGAMTINVYGAPGQAVGDLADAVVRKVEDLFAISARQMGAPPEAS